MINYFYGLNPILQAFLASSIAWFLTMLGSSAVFLFKNNNKNFFNSILGLSAGIMLSASFWSLLNPAIDFCKELKISSWFNISIGFLTGYLFLIISEKLFSIFYKHNVYGKLVSKRNFLLFLSITLHNIPEGLVVGVAFGSLFFLPNKLTFFNAISIALGIAIQNFPEGAAISLPMSKDGFSPMKAFNYGQLSAIVEPIFAVIGSMLIMKVKILLPFSLSFAAGAMIYVVVTELIPEFQKNNKKISNLFFIIGFIIMMILDISLG